MIAIRQSILPVLLLILPAFVTAQFAVTTSNFPSGSGTVSSASFSASSTVGQPVVGTSSSQNFSTGSGFGNYDRFEPVAICMSFGVTLENGQATITAMNIDGGSSDNVGIASLEISETTFDENDVGQNMVQLTVTDYVGLTDTCTAIVDVVSGIIETKDFWIFK